MQQKRTRIVLMIGIALALCVVFFVDRQEVGNERGMIAENFQLPMHEQSEGELYDYHGDVIVLNMWASWCEPCRDEMPALMKLQEDYGEQGLSVVTVNMQTTERTLKDGPAFIEEMNITLPVFFDEKGDVADRYKVAGMPMTYIISRDGTIQHVLPGEVTYEGIEELIKPLF
ncbi:TlpA disulfide reductase family protein [Bacillus suaedae]|uniref:TlpA family protein disulfide reductase n=1 Tax=Halalkalibacter suaedae TaxID=2822140 RepID=A0A941ANR8_9BACI|nr:TlpA disulfide reductase family protein [Bacillus suaedae]MBP3951086.1 TlpA family protein disulfide reductase [Bacillus suaedae]